MNQKLKEEIELAAERLYGMDNLIPPIPNDGYIPDKDLPKVNSHNPMLDQLGQGTYPDPIKEPFLSVTTIDCLIALSLASGFVCMGMALR